MTVRGRLTWNIDDYLEKIVQSEKDVDQAVQTLLVDNRDYIGGLMFNFLRQTSDSWTGAAAKTLFVSPVQRDGNFIFIELGAHTDKDPAAFYKEYGRPSQAAEPFLRPTLVFLRRKQLRYLMEQVMKKFGLEP